MNMIKTNRRSLITGLISLIAAPAIVRVSSIMPVKQMYADGGFIRDSSIIDVLWHGEFYLTLDEFSVEHLKDAFLGIALNDAKPGDIVRVRL
jgi:hypothetical protein